MEEEIKKEMTPEQEVIAKCVTSQPWYTVNLFEAIDWYMKNTDLFGEEFEAWCKTPEGMRYAE